jgi:hypothetical protein
MMALILLWAEDAGYTFFQNLRLLLIGTRVDATEILGIYSLFLIHELICSCNPN